MLSSSSPGRASKRAKPTAPYNHRLHTPIVYSAARTADAIRALQTGREEAIVVDAGMSINYFDASVVGAVTSANVD